MCDRVHHCLHNCCRCSPGYEDHNPVLWRIRRHRHVEDHLVCSGLAIAMSDCCVRMRGIPAIHAKMNCSHYVHCYYRFEKNDDCRCCCFCRATRGYLQCDGWINNHRSPPPHLCVRFHTHWNVLESCQSHLLAVSPCKKCQADRQRLWIQLHHHNHYYDFDVCCRRPAACTLYLVHGCNCRLVYHNLQSHSLPHKHNPQKSIPSRHIH